MKKKMKVAVLMGGKTPEHEISLITGREVVRNLNKSRYDVLPIVIPRTGEKWQSLTSKKLLSKLDVVFIAMHGPYGEDGTVQGMLELAGIPYTGPGVLASALGMNKIMFRKVLASEKIPIPNYIIVKKGQVAGRVFKALGKLPCFVKPHNQGSSVGASIVRTKKDLAKALNLAYQFSEIALVDEYIKGMEVTCGVLGNENPRPLPLVEIIPKKAEFFDYESKYAESGAEEIVPARISVKLTKKIQKMAIDVYKAIGCKGFSRVDFLLKNERYPVVLEINTIPGLTPMSLLPKAAKAAGISYSQLLDKIIGHALEN